MRIAQIAPLHESCPPRLYGGTERVVSWLTEELVRLGHDVTLFASGDSLTQARLVPVTTQALRLSGVQDPLPYHLVMLDEVLRQADSFDVLHFHTDYLHYPLFARGPWPILTTLHGRQDLVDIVPIHRAFPRTPLVSISDAQRRPLAWANWVGTVHHGLPRDLIRQGRGEGGYLAFLGRVSPEKGLDRAIALARHVGMPLKVAAKIDKHDADYFEREIVPQLQEPGVEFVGEIDDREKPAFLGEAAALLFPIRWPEPFGLVMIESMAAGTPVLAFREGSVPEIVEDGVAGVVVDTLDAAKARMGELLALDRAGVRAAFERRFTAERMAADYVRLFETIAGQGTTRPASALKTGDGLALQPAGTA